MNKLNLDEIILNLIQDYPRINSNWVSRACDCSVSTANRHLKKWREAGVIHGVMVGAYTNYELIYYFPEAMPEFFAKPKDEAQ